jgi:hypothetical protein
MGLGPIGSLYAPLLASSSGVSLPLTSLCPLTQWMVRLFLYLPGLVPCSTHIVIPKLLYYGKELVARKYCPLINAHQRLP